ncbi:MAG: hypothetical protein WA885_04695 [Phormidesmis sp.]
MTRGLSGEPMSASKVISTGWRLYTSNFSKFCWIALVATGWSLIPTVANLLMTFAPVYLGKPLSVGLSILLLLIVIVLFIFCTAQSLGQFAGISRITYRSLSGTLEGGIAETDRAALRLTRSRKFSFLGATILQSFIVFFLTVALLIAIAVIVLLMMAILSRLGGTAGLDGNSPVVTLVFGVITIAAVLVVAIIYSYVFTRFMLIEQPLAVEENCGAIDAIARSWELTKHHVWHTAAVAFLLFVVVGLGYIVVFALLGTLLFSVVFGTVSTGAALDPNAMVLVLLPFYAGIIVFSLVASVVIVPFFKTTFTVLYFDLHNRLARRSFRDRLNADPASNL